MELKNIRLVNFTINNGTIHCIRKERLGMNRHWHTYYEVILFENGKGKHIINNRFYDVVAGDIAIMRLTDFHEFHVEKSVDCLDVEIPPGVLSKNIINMLTVIDEDIIVNLNKEDFRKAKEFCLMIGALNDKTDPFYEHYKMHIASVLVLFILEKMEKDVSKKCSENNIRLKEIITYITENLCTDLSISGIAEKFFVSKEYLCSFFKKNTGVTIFSYIRTARLNRAVELLTTTDKKIIEICEMSGFNAMSTFLRDFKKEYGVSPSEMRQKSIEQ